MNISQSTLLISTVVGMFWIFINFKHSDAVAKLDRLITSKSFFSKCQLPRLDSNNIEQLKQSIPLRKVIASFDVSKNVSFFKLESCQSLVLCFVTKTNVIQREDFGKSNLRIWAKLVDTFEGKGFLEPFKEDKHRKQYGRSSLEASCIDGHFVIRRVSHKFLRRKGVTQKRKNQTDDVEDGSRSKPLKASRRGSKKPKREMKRRKKNGKTGKKASRNRRNRKKKKTFNAQDCEDDSSVCLRTCVGWGNQWPHCSKLRISCSFHCPLKRDWRLNNPH